MDGNKTEAEAIMQIIKDKLISLNFVMASCNLAEAILSVLIIGAVTFVICIFGLKFGKILGDKLEKRATIFGGVILILIGIKIMFFG